MTSSPGLGGPHCRRIIGPRLQVVGHALALVDYRGDRLLDALSRVHLPQVTQHQRARQDRGRGVHLILAGILRRAPVDRLEDDADLSDVRPRSDSQPAFLIRYRPTERADSERTW